MIEGHNLFRLQVDRSETRGTSVSEAVFKTPPGSLHLIFLGQIQKALSTSEQRLFCVGRGSGTRTPWDVLHL